MRKIQNILIWGLFDTAIMTARCFNDSNFKIYGMDYEKKHLGFKSRLIDAFEIPNPNLDEELWLKHVVDWLKKFEETFILIPTSDEFIFFASKYKKELSPYIISIIPDLVSILNILERDRQFELAVSSGLNVPKFYRGPVSLEELIALDFSYPLAIKPVNSPEWKKSFSNKGFVFANYKDLAQKLPEINRSCVRYLVQEIIEGDNSCNFEVNSLYLPNGNLFQHTIKKVRQYPDRFGTATCIESTENKVVEELATKFIRSLNLIGFSNIEFKLDKFDGKYYYIETNPRVWLQVNFSMKLGLNLPKIYYDDLTGCFYNKSSDTLGSGKWVDFLPDIFFYFKYRRINNLKLTNFIKSWFPVKSTGLFSFTDPKPFFTGLQIFKKINKLVR